MKTSINCLVIALAAILSPAIAMGQNMFLTNWSNSDIYGFTSNGTRIVFTSWLVPMDPVDITGNWLVPMDPVDITGNLFKPDFSCGIYEFTSDGIHSSNISELVSSCLALDNVGSLFDVDLSDSNIYEFASDQTPGTFTSWLLPPDMAGIAGNSFKADFSCSSSEFTSNGTRSTFTPWAGLILLSGLSSSP